MHVSYSNKYGVYGTHSQGELLSGSGVGERERGNARERERTRENEREREKEGEREKMKKMRREGKVGNTSQGRAWKRGGRVSDLVARRAVVLHHASKPPVFCIQHKGHQEEGRDHEPTLDGKMTFRKNK